VEGVAAAEEELVPLSVPDELEPSPPPEELSPTPEELEPSPPPLDDDTTGVCGSGLSSLESDEQERVNVVASTKAAVSASFVSRFVMIYLWVDGWLNCGNF